MDATRQKINAMFLLFSLHGHACHAPERSTQCFHCSISTCMPRARLINAMFPLFNLHMHATLQKDQRNVFTVHFFTCVPRSRKINAMFPLFNLLMRATHQKDQSNVSTIQFALLTRCHSHLTRQNKPP